MGVRFSYSFIPNFGIMDPQEFLTRVSECCPELVRPSWVLKKSSKPNRPSKIATKFGGCSPWVSEKWKWPHCGICQKTTSFILQINLSDLPEEFKTRTHLPAGLLQLFDCTACYEYSGGSLSSARIVPQEEISISSLQYLAASAAASKDLTVTNLPSKLQQFVQDIYKFSGKHPHWKEQIPLQIFQEQFVASWKKNETLEVPHNDEWNPLDAAKLGISCADIQNIMEYKNYNLENDEDFNLSGPSAGTKAGGWFDWDASLGYPGYPDCPECPGSPRMDTVFMQIDMNQLFSDYQEALDRYPELVFVSLCPSCQKPATFESFPPPLES